MGVVGGGVSSGKVRVQLDLLKSCLSTVPKLWLHGNLGQVETLLRLISQQVLLHT